MDHMRIFPSLRDSTIVPIDGTVIITKFALFRVLSNGIEFFFGGNFKFRFGIFGNLCYETIFIKGLIRNIMPGGNLFSFFILKMNSKFLGSSGTAVSGTSEIGGGGRKDSSISSNNTYKLDLTKQ
jgi:hypothetical protein